MAGETEDCIGFQADCLPTGSISFGRFEAESLSWERRSSFSHNRYLEEVEKFSTPGSVTQKKAYFEAHFKKKALLHQASSESQNEAEYQTGHDIDDHTKYIEEFGDLDNEEQLEFSWYDVTPTASEEHEVKEHEQEEQISTFEYLTEPTPCDEERIIDFTVEPSDLDESHQTESGYDVIPSDKDKLCIVVEQKSDNKAVIVEELHEKRDISSKSPTVEKSDDNEAFQIQSRCYPTPSDKDKMCIDVEQQTDNKSVIMEELLEKREISSKSLPVEKSNAFRLKKAQKTSLKVKELVEPKTAKTKSRTQLPVQQTLSKSSTSVSSVKASTKSTRKVESENTSGTKTASQPPSRALTPTSSYSRSLKSEGSGNLRPKVRQESKSEKDLRARKSSILPHSVSGKTEVDVHQSANRPKRIADLAKTDVKQSGSIFSFKSDERAEKRKEYYMKLEEKLHAKEAEMNEIQARTQEQTEAEMKQFRRSLNFKATPMPSFYHENMPRISEGKKMAATSAKSQRGRSPASRTSREKSPALANASNHEHSSSIEPNRVPESAIKSETGKNDERSKPNVQRQHRRDGGVKNGEEKVSRVRGGGVRRVMKGGIGGGSVPVHVAS